MRMGGLELEETNRSGNTGRAVGLMTEPWIVLQDAKGLANSLGGIPYALARLVDDNDNLVRLVLSAGGSVRTVPKVGTDLAGSRVRDMTAPSWFYLDITMRRPGKTLPVAVTFAMRNRIVASEEESGTEGVFAAAGRRLGDWEWGRANILKPLGMSETWSRIIGECSPAFGALTHGEMLLGETDFMIGAVRTGYVFPDAYDSADMGRVEGILGTLGATDAVAGTDYGRVRERLALVNMTLGLGTAWTADEKSSETTFR